MLDNGSDERATQMRYIKKIFKKERPNSLILLILVILIPFMVLLVREGVRYFIGAQTSTAAFSFSPSVVNLTSNKTVKVLLDAKDKKVAFVSLELRFDRNKVRVSSEIKTSDRLRNVIRKTTPEEANASGQVRLVLALHVDNVSSPLSGVFEVAQLNFEPIVSDPTSSLVISNSNLQVVNIDAVSVPVETAEALFGGGTNPTNTPVPTGSGTNLLRNPSFENAIDSDEYTRTGSGSFSQAKDAAHSGSKSLKIVSSQSSSSYARWISKNQMIQVQSGKRYEATIWIKTKDVNSRAVLTMNFWGPGAYDNASGAVTSSSVSGTKDWQKVIVTGTAPSGTNYARIEMKLYGSGTAWFDDGSVIQK